MSPRSRPGGRRTALVLVGLLVVVLLVRRVAFTTVRLATAGMEPTLSAGDVLLVDRLRSPVVGDVVLVTFPGESVPAVKRLVAAGGAALRLDAAGLEVDGEGAPTGDTAAVTVMRQGCRPVSLSAPVERRGRRRYPTLPGGAGAELRVPPAQLFLLGDNRAGSSDSRQWGPVSEDAVEGVVVARLWSASACD